MKAADHNELPAAKVPSSAPSQLAGATRNAALAVAAAYFMVLLDGSILHTSIPLMAQSLRVEPLHMTLAVTAYLVAAAASMPVSSWFADRFGARRVFMGALLVFTLASLWCGMAQGLNELALARTLQGLGGGLLMPVGRLITMRQASKAELMRVTALITWPALMAPVLGPMLGGYVSTYLDWRWNFWLNLPIGVVVLVVAYHLLPRDGASQANPLDWKGAIMASLCSVALLGGLELATRVEELQLRWFVPAGLVLASAVLFAWLRRHLAQHPAPLLTLAPLGIRTFAVSTWQGALPLIMCLQATPFLLPLMFQLGMGSSAAQAGLMLMAYFLGNLMIKPLTTPLLRRLTFRQVTVGGSLAAGLAIGLCATIGPQTPTLAINALLFAAGALRSIQMTAVQSLMFADVPPALRGSASTLSVVTQQINGALGVMLASLCLVISARQRPEGTLQLPDFHNAFLVVGALAMLCSLLFLRLQPSDGDEVRKGS